MAGKSEIGTLAVRLTAEASEFNKAVDRAGVKLHDLAREGSRGFGFQGAGQAAGMFGAALRDPFGGSLNGAGALGAAAGGAVGGALHAAKEGADQLWESILHVGEAMHETAKRAEELQISTRELVGLNVLARDRAEEVQTAVQHLTRRIGEAAAGSTEARASFARLGLDWKQLEASSPVDAFGKVNDAIKEQATTFDRGAAAQEAYGRAARGIMRIIEQGSAGISAAQNAAAQRGLLPDPEFTKAYEEYGQAKRELDQTWQGIKNKLAAAIGTPLLKMAADAAKGLADVIQYWFSHKETPEEKGRREAEEATKAAAGARAAEASRGKAEAAKIAEAAMEGSKHLQAQLAALNMSAGAAAIYAAQLEKGAKFTEAQKRAIMEQANLQEQLKKATEEQGKIKAIDESVLTPVERVNKKMEELEDLFRRNKISAQTFSRAAAAAMEEFHKSLPSDGGPLKLLTFGSQADRQFGLQIERDAKSHNANPWEQFKADRARAMALDEQRNRLLEQLLQSRAGDQQWRDEIDRGGF
jgi:hypothetical protein